MPTDKQRKKSVSHEVTRLRTEVATLIYQEMSHITDFIEEVQEDLDDAKNNIHKVKQRINELEGHQ